MHRIGRTARAGATGTAISFLAEEESKELREIERLIGTALPSLDLEGFYYHQRMVPDPDRSVKKSGRPTPQGGRPRTQSGGGRSNDGRRSSGGGYRGNEYRGGSQRSFSDSRGGRG